MFKGTNVCRGTARTCEAGSVTLSSFCGGGGEAQRGRVTWPKPHSWLTKQAGLRPRRCDSRAPLWPMPIVEIRAPGGPQSLIFWLQTSPSVALRLLQGPCQCELTSRTALRAWWVSDGTVIPGTALSTPPESPVPGRPGVVAFSHGDLPRPQSPSTLGPLNPSGGVFCLALTFSVSPTIENLPRHGDCAPSTGFPSGLVPHT